MNNVERRSQWAYRSKDCRNSFGIGRDKFSRILGVSPRTVLRWENNNVLPNVSQQAKITILNGFFTKSELGKKSSDNDYLDQEEMFDMLNRASFELKKHEQTGSFLQENNPDYNQNYSIFFKNINEYVDQNEWDDIYQLIKPTVDEHPIILEEYSTEQKQRIFNWIGYSSFRQGKYEESLIYYNKAISLNGSGDYKKYIDTNIGTSCMRLKQYEVANRYYQNVLSEDESFVPALYNLIVLNSLQDKLEDAVRFHKNMLFVIKNDKKLLDWVYESLMKDGDLVSYRKSDVFITKEKISD